MPEFNAVPRLFSDVPDDVSLIVAERGATELKLPLLPQGVQVASLLEAQREDGRPLYRRVAIQVPRRSTKTTAITNTLLGRCLTYPGYRVISTAQDGTRASAALKEIMWLLDQDSTEYRTYWSGGGEMIIFANGSRWERRPPIAGKFRGSAADALWFDEAGEYDPATSEELVQGALPLMDTRPMGQVIISGTPAKSRAGLLWDSLEHARAGKKGVGGLDYGMGEEDDPADEAVWRRVHPGIASGLTDIEIIRERFEQMPLPSFMVEYLGYWPKHAFDRAIDPEAWAETTEPKIAPEDGFVLGLSVHKDEDSASLVAAWRDPEGVGHVAVVDHRPGTDWLPIAAYALLVKYPRLRLVYDEVGANIAPVRVLLRENKVKARVTPATSKDVQAGQANLVRLIHAREVKHPDQPSLNAAADGLQWRTSPEKGRWFGWARSDADISPLSAAALALWHVDQVPEKRQRVV